MVRGRKGGLSRVSAVGRVLGKIESERQDLHVMIEFNPAHRQLTVRRCIDCCLQLYEDMEAETRRLPLLGIRSNLNVLNVSMATVCDR
jgi:hypothetical protein